VFAGTTGDFDFGILWDTPNRELAQAQGRWVSPDPAGASWNAYAYVTNPNIETDRTGLYCDLQQAAEGCGLGGFFNEQGVGLGVSTYSSWDGFYPGAFEGQWTGEGIFGTVGADSGDTTGSNSWSWTVTPGEFGPNAINPDGTGSYPGEPNSSDGGSGSVWNPYALGGQGQWQTPQEYAASLSSFGSVNNSSWNWGWVNSFMGAQNGYVTAGTDVVGLVAPLAGKTGKWLGPAGSIVSMANNPDPMNVVFNVTPLLFEETGVPIAFITAEADLGAFLSTNILNGAVDSIPLATPNGVPNPAVMDECQIAGACGVTSGLSGPWY